jgi:hypothetical protein
MIEPLIHLAGFDFVPQTADQIELCLRTTNGPDPSTLEKRDIHFVPATL